MNRRQLLSLAGSALASAHRPAWAQTTRTHRVAWLAAGSKADTEAYFDAFRAGLRDLGYQEGRNLVIDARFGDYTRDRAEQFAIELAALRPEVLVTQGAAARQAERLTPPIPTAFVFSGDPVVAGLAKSLARPGRHLTGVCLLSLELVGKRMEILKEMVPKLSRVAIIANPDHPGESGERGASKTAAERLGVRVSYYPVRNPAELDAALSDFAASRAEGAVVFPDALTNTRRSMLATFFLKNRIPSAAGWAPYAESGFLVSYGPDLLVAYRRAAYFADRIIKGAKPADLPIEMPGAIEMVVNRRTATALNVSLPSTIAFRANRVID